MKGWLLDNSTKPTTTVKYVISFSENNDDDVDDVPRQQPQIKDYDKNKIVLTYNST